MSCVFSSVMTVNSLNSTLPRTGIFESHFSKQGLCEYFYKLMISITSLSTVLCQMRCFMTLQYSSEEAIQLTWLHSVAGTERAAIKLCQVDGFLASAFSLGNSRAGSCLKNAPNHFWLGAAQFESIFARRNLKCLICFCLTFNNDMGCSGNGRGYPKGSVGVERTV